MEIRRVFDSSVDSSITLTGGAGRVTRLLGAHRRELLRRWQRDCPMTHLENRAAINRAKVPQRPLTIMQMRR